MDTHFITYGNDVFRNSRSRIAEEARNLGIYKSVTSLSPELLPNNFRTKHNDILTTQARGGGYWIWKPFVVYQKLLEVNTGDVVQWTDAGCSLNPKGIDNMNKYIDICANSKNGLLGFDIGHLEKTWTKQDLFTLLNADKFKDTQQVITTYFFVKKTNYNVELFKHYSEIAIKDNYHFINDSPSNLPNDTSFKEHRHDQSILSLLYKLNDAAILPDESYCDTIAFLQHIPDYMQYSPIFASRIRN